MFPTVPVPEVLGAYKVIRRLSTAGSADVYLGRMDGPMGFQRLCALKLVPNAIDGHARLAEELAREASICSRLNHPAVVRMFDFFEHERRLVLVLEHVDGADLERLVQHLVRRKQRLGDNGVWYLGHQIAGALRHAHTLTDESGHATPVIHRNIVPENVLIAWDGQVRLSGFGLGKIVGRTPDTVVGMVRGTPGYMSPEQARGERLTPRSDVYSFGVLLWALLSGQAPPTDGRRPEPLSKLRADLPREIVAAIEAAMQPSPDKRTISAGDVEQWLSRLTQVEAGKNDLREKILMLRSVRGGDAASPESMRGGRGAPQPRRNVSLRGVRAAKKPPSRLSVPPASRSTRPPRPLSEKPGQKASEKPGQKAPGGVRTAQPTLIGGLLGTIGSPALPTGITPPAAPVAPPPSSAMALSVPAATPAPASASVMPPPAAAGDSVMPPSFAAPEAAPPSVSYAMAPPIPPPMAAPTAPGPWRDLRDGAGATDVAKMPDLGAPLSHGRSALIVTSVAAVVLLAGVWILLGIPSNDRDPEGHTSAAVARSSAPAATAPTTVATVTAASAAVVPAVAAADPPKAPTTALPPTSASAAPVAPAEEYPELPPGYGYLNVRSTEPAGVYVRGKLVGEANTNLRVPCGRFFVRLGVLKGRYARVPTWIAPGESVLVPCQAALRIDMSPSPTPVVR